MAAKSQFDRLGAFQQSRGRIEDPATATRGVVDWLGGRVFLNQPANEYDTNSHIIFR